MSPNFTAIDITACLASFALFSLFAFVPGYTIGWLADLLEFRQRTLAAQLTISVPLSIAIAPSLAFLAGRLLSMTAVWVVFGAIWLAFAVLLARRILAAAPRWKFGKLPLAHVAIVGGWLAAGLLSLIDLQFKDRLYYSVVSFDYSLRTAVVSAISRTGIPPANPFFFPGHGFPIRYHYFWLIPCSLVNSLGGSLVSARQAIIGGTLWCGVGLIATVPLYLRLFHPAGADGIRRRSLIGIGLLAVTGLDFVPNLMRDFSGIPLPEPEWWNNFQVSSWTTSVLWVPHHTAALIAGLMALLIVWNSGRAGSFGRRALWAAAAGLSLATCIGSSIYVGFILALALLIWTAILFLLRSHREAAFAVCAGAIAILAVVPDLLDLRGTSTGAAAATTGSVLMFSVSDFVFSGLFRGWIQGSMLRLNLVNALLLPANYFLELGAFLVGGIWTLRRWLADRTRLNRYQLATLTFASTSILICTFFRSGVIVNNDLGSRGFLLAQFILLLWMVDILERKLTLSPGRRAFLGFLTFIGVVGSVHEAAVLRAFPIASDLWNIPRTAWLSKDHNLGRRTYALREGYAELKAELPANAIVQHNPNDDPDDLPYGLYADRQVVAETPSCAVALGGDPRLCPPIQARLDTIFEGVSPPDQLDRACADLSIAAILVKDTDPAWSHRESWVWRRKPIAANQFLRAIPCGGQPASASRAAAFGDLHRSR